MATLLKIKPYGLIKSQLERNDEIIIARCTDCPSICGLGKEKVDQLAERLKKDGFNVGGTDSIHLGCFYDQVKKQKNLKGNTIVVWGCDAHVYNLKRAFPKRKVVPALITLGLMAWDAEGVVHLVKEYKK